MLPMMGINSLLQVVWKAKHRTYAGLICADQRRDVLHDLETQRATRFWDGLQPL